MPHTDPEARLQYMQDWREKHAQDPEYIKRRRESNQQSRRKRLRNAETREKDRVRVLNWRHRREAENPERHAEEKKRKREMMRYQYHNNPEIRLRRLTASKQARIRNPKKYAFINWRKAIRRKFGITPEQYDAILKRQGSTCALCHRPPQGKRLAVDHNHRTKIVRGLLCDGCNRLLGRIEARISLIDLYFYLTRDRALGLEKV